MPANDFQEFSREDSDRFAKLQWWVGAALLLVGTCFGFASYWLLLWSNRWLASLDAKAQFLFLPETWWFFLPFFGGLCLAWELTIRLWILFGNPTQAQKYVAWSNGKTGFNATRVLRLMSIGIALPIGLATIMALPIHTSFGDAGLTVGHFATPLPRHYSYSEIRTITVAEGFRTRDGGFQRRPEIVLGLSDGRRWSSADNRDPDKSINESLLKFLRQKTGLEIKYIDAFPFGTD